MIPAGVRLPYLDSRDLYLLQLALPLEILQPDICGQRSRRPGDRPTATYAKAGGAQSGSGDALATPSAPLAGRLINDASAAPRAVPPGEVPGLNKLAWDLNALGPDIHWSKGTLVSLLLIKARLMNIESCIIYLQHLMRMIDQVSVEARPVGTAATYNNGVELYRTFFVIKAQNHTGSQVSGSQGSGSQDSETPHVASQYRAGSQLSGTHAAMLNVSQGRTNGPAAEHATNSNKQQRPGGRTSWSKITIKEFIKEIFSQVYTYVFIFMLSFTALVLRYRM